jgi:DNA-binding MarR family transcriptional regulator
MGQIARELGLTCSIASSIVADLEQEGLVTEDEGEPSTAAFGLGAQLSTLG